MTLTTFSGRNASQNEFELRSFIALLQNRNVMRYLEIGARHGDTFHEIMTSLPGGSFGMAVDLPGGMWGTRKSRDSLRRVEDDLVRRGYKIKIVFGDSQSSEIAQLVTARGPFDATLIDADHRLLGVSLDYSLYGGLAPLTAFHDVVGTGQIEKVNGFPVEVPMLWEKLKRSQDELGVRYHEFIDDGSAMGIGVLEKHA